MSRETKKKPGDMLKARKRHLAKQALTDKIKALKADLDHNKEVWFTHEDPNTGKIKRLRLQKFDNNVPTYVLARVNGKVQVLFAPDKYSISGKGKGSIFLTNDFFAAFVPKAQVLADVLAEHER
ncbi:hypothetical protein C4565_08375 [Candidatus Parcubacteria bacterium]|nr:MAG: hypothetical protein C4565_08375 [Candidatus Parcubacteria bacterium]